VTRIENGFTLRLVRLKSSNRLTLMKPRCFCVPTQPIIVLNEATSALDSESEKIIKNSFTEILKNKTAIVVTHRLSTLSDMDRIIVIHKGKLIENGTHDELVSAAGLYAKLWNRQSRLQDQSS